MIRTRNFVWAHGPAGPGWLVENAAPGWFAGPGFLSSHDTLEHLSNKPDWAHELRAAGVAAFDVRGMAHRDFGSIAEDIVNFAAQGHNFDAPAAPARWSKPLPRVQEARVQALANEMRVIIDRGLEKLKTDALARRSAPAGSIENAPHFVDKALPWMRLGYAGALRIYGRHGRDVGKLMDTLTDAINKDHDRLPPVIGDKLEVRVDLKERTYTLTRSGNEKMTAKERRVGAFVDTITGLFGVPA